MTGPSRYSHLLFNSPCSSGRAAAVAAAVAARRPRLVLDIGCGWGELLLRTVAAAPAAQGLGVDDDTDLLERALAAARDRGLDGRVEFVPALAPEVTADAVLCSGASHVWGTVADALTALAAVVEPGGVLVFGEGVWDTVAPVGPAAPDDMADLPDLAGLVDTAVAAGFRPLRIASASPQEWEEFESGYAADREQWLLTHPAHPDAQRVREQADEHRAMWLHGYRQALGYAWLTLGRPVSRETPGG